MIITDGEKTILLEQLAQMICNSYDADDCEGKCPAAEHCRHGHNGMIDWLRKVVGE